MILWSKQKQSTKNSLTLFSSGSNIFCHSIKGICPALPGNEWLNDFTILRSQKVSHCRLTNSSSWWLSKLIGEGRCFWSIRVECHWQNLMEWWIYSLNCRNDWKTIEAVHLMACSRCPQDSGPQMLLITAWPAPGACAQQFLIGKKCTVNNFQHPPSLARKPWALLQIPSIHFLSTITVKRQHLGHGWAGLLRSDLCPEWGAASRQ